MRVVGVNAYPGGWLAVEYDAVKEKPTTRVHDTFGELLIEHPTASCVAVDIPIGLASRGTRACDVEAGCILGRPRSSSVFPAPDPQLLATVLDGNFDHTRASEHSHAVFGKGVSKQALRARGGPSRPSGRRRRVRRARRRGDRSSHGAANGTPGAARWRAPESAPLTTAASGRLRTPPSRRAAGSPLASSRPAGR
jgi:hypothetical protein